MKLLQNLTGGTSGTEKSSVSSFINGLSIVDPMAIFALIYLSLPSIIILFTSFEPTSYIHFPPEEISFYWYLILPQKTEFINAFIRSLFVSTTATLVCAILGTLAAYGMMRYNIRLKRSIQAYLLLPYLVPLVATGAVLYIIFSSVGLINNILVVAFALALVNFPLMFWSVSSSVNSLNPTLEYAAKNLGAEGYQTFLLVTLPLLGPGIISGSLLVFIISMNEFVVSVFVITPDTVTLPVLLYNSIRTSISPLLSAISVIYIILSTVAIFVFDRCVGLERFFHS